jgi:vacuolar protein sorting-associated protein IST1
MSSMPAFLGGYNPNKLKPNLKMAVHRLQISASKRSNLIKTQKREIANLLAEKPHPKEEKARIRAEALIREDFTIEAYEILELQCELLHERMRLIDSTKECPGDLIQTVSTLIWACDRVDCPELVEVKKQLTKKYGVDFADRAKGNVGGCLNERVVHKLSVQPPSAFLVMSYLREIAAEYGVEYEPKEEEAREDVAMAAPTGFSVPVAPGSDLGEVYNTRGQEAEIPIGPTGTAPPPLPQGWAYSQDGLLTHQGAPGNAHAAAAAEQPPPYVSVPPQQEEELPPYDKGGMGGGEDEGKEEEGKEEEGKGEGGPKYDDLAARFNALKR